METAVTPFTLLLPNIDRRPNAATDFFAFEREISKVGTLKLLFI